MDKFIKNLARGAGKILRDGFGTQLEIKEKADFWDFSTQYDLAAEEFVSKKILKKYPSHGVLGEENGHLGSEKNFWIVDPLDGTRNFSRGITFFCVIIAFVKNGEIVLGTVYDPMREELFFAEKKKGAFLNGKKIKANPVKDLESSLSSLVWHPDVTGKPTSVIIQDLILEKRIWNSSLASGGLTLAYVGAGRLDLDLSIHGHPWDYAAGSLVAKEAGAKVTDFDGKPYKWNSKGIIAANPVLHKKIMTELKGKRK